MSTPKTLKKSPADLPAVSKSPKPPTLREIISKIITTQMVNEQVLSVVCNKLDSVGTESARIYNRFDGFESMREKELKKRVESLESELHFVKNNVEAIREFSESTIRANHFLRGRLATLEQVANIKPLEPTKNDASIHAGPPKFDQAADPFDLGLLRR